MTKKEQIKDLLFNSKGYEKAVWNAARLSAKDQNELMKKEPKRIQRKRTRGWKMPPNTVYVGRPSKWGNPFRLNLTTRHYNGYGREDTDMSESEIRTYNLKKFSKYIKLAKLNIEELKGKNLACWCPLDKLCHADILLKIANE